MCVADVIKNKNVKVLDLMSITNETRCIIWHETCKCKGRLDESVCDNKERWNDDKCRCERKELIHKGVCDKGSSNCECECDKSSELWDEIKNEVETINGGKKGDYGKNFTKIKFNTYDKLPLNKSLMLHMLTIIVRCIFEEDGKFYPQLYLDDCFYEL